MKNILMVLIFVLLIINCNNSNKRPTYAKNADVAKSQTHPGKKLMETHCYSCHNPNTSEADRIAPPMIAIKCDTLMEQQLKKSLLPICKNG